jgi:DNA-binding NarL/FixJ family response regulator
VTEIGRRKFVPPVHGGDVMRVLIVDDHQLFAEVIGSSLEERGFTVVGIVASGIDALPAVRNTKPDVVLMDMRLPHLDGAAAGNTIGKEFPNVKMVAVTALKDERVFADATRSGFDAFLTKDTPLNDFIAKVTAAAKGKAVLPRRLPEARSRSDEERDAELLAGQLTTREREVLELLAEGATSRRIAQRLSVSPHTVRTHIQNILTKLQLHSRLEAAAFAVRYSLARP